MAKPSPYETGELSDAMLLVLACTARPAHGYLIMRELRECSRGEIEIGPATMYRILKGMRDAGWIEELGAEGTRRAYRATDAGMRVLERDMARRRVVLDVAGRCLVQEEGDGDE